MIRKLLQRTMQRTLMHPMKHADYDLKIACPLLELHETLTSGLQIPSAAGPGTPPTEMDIYKCVQQPMGGAVGGAAQAGRVVGRQFTRDRVALCCRHYIRLKNKWDGDSSLTFGDRFGYANDAMSVQLSEMFQHLHDIDAGDVPGGATAPWEAASTAMAARKEKPVLERAKELASSKGPAAAEPASGSRADDGTSGAAARDSATAAGGSADASPAAAATSAAASRSPDSLHANGIASHAGGGAVASSSGSGSSSSAASTAASMPLPASYTPSIGVSTHTNPHPTIHFAAQAIAEDDAKAADARLRRLLQQRYGFALWVGPSQAPTPLERAGLYIRGRALPGAVVGLYPGAVFNPEMTQKAIDQGHLGNAAVPRTWIPRYDQAVIDVHAATAPLHNPYAIAHHCREPPAGIRPNVMRLAVNFRDVDEYGSRDPGSGGLAVPFPPHLRGYIPNVWGAKVDLGQELAGMLEQEVWVKGVALVALRTLWDEELFVDPGFRRAWRTRLE